MPNPSILALIVFKIPAFIRTDRQNIYTLWGRKRFLLPVTSDDLVYPFTLRVTSITRRNAVIPFPLRVTGITISFDQVQLEYRMQLLETYCVKLLDIQGDIDVLYPINDLRESVEDKCIIIKALHRSAIKE